MLSIFFVSFKFKFIRLTTLAVMNLLRKCYDISNLKLGEANHNYAKHIITHNS